MPKKKKSDIPRDFGSQNSAQTDVRNRTSLEQNVLMVLPGFVSFYRILENRLYIRAHRWWPAHTYAPCTSCPNRAQRRCRGGRSYPGDPSLGGLVHEELCPSACDVMSAHWRRLLRDARMQARDISIMWRGCGRHSRCISPSSCCDL